MAIDSSTTPLSADRRHHRIQASIALAALALAILAAGIRLGQCQSPLVTAALQRTGGHLLLADEDVSRGIVDVIVLNPTKAAQSHLGGPSC